MPDVRIPGPVITPPKAMAPALKSEPKPAPAESPPKPLEPPRPLPNLWLKEVLAQPALPPDWFSVLVYTMMAGRFKVQDLLNYVKRKVMA